MTRLYELLNDGTLESRSLGRARLIRRIDIERLGTTWATRRMYERRPGEGGAPNACDSGDRRKLPRIGYKSAPASWQAPRGISATLLKPPFRKRGGR